MSAAMSYVVPARQLAPLAGVTAVIVPVADKHDFFDMILGVCPTATPPTVPLPPFSTVPVKNSSKVLFLPVRCKIGTTEPGKTESTV